MRLLPHRAPPMPPTLPRHPILRLPPLHPHPRRRMLLPPRCNQHPHQPHHHLRVHHLLIHQLQRNRPYPTHQHLIRLRRTQLRLQRHPLLPLYLREPVRTHPFIIPSHTAFAHFQPKLPQTTLHHFIIHPAFIKQPRVHYNPLRHRQSLQLGVTSYLPSHIISPPNLCPSLPHPWLTLLPVPSRSTSCLHLGIICVSCVANISGLPRKTLTIARCGKSTTCVEKHGKRWVKAV